MSEPENGEPPIAFVEFMKTLQGEVSRSEGRTAKIEFGKVDGSSLDEILAKVSAKLKTAMLDVSKLDPREVSAHLFDERWSEMKNALAAIRDDNRDHETPTDERMKELCAVITDALRPLAPSAFEMVMGLSTIASYLPSTAEGVRDMLNVASARRG